MVGTDRLRKKKKHRMQNSALFRTSKYRRVSAAAVCDVFIVLLLIYVLYRYKLWAAVHALLFFRFRQVSLLVDVRSQSVTQNEKIEQIFIISRTTLKPLEITYVCISVWRVLLRQLFYAIIYFNLLSQVFYHGRNQKIQKTLKKHSIILLRL